MSRDDAEPGLGHHADRPSAQQLLDMPLVARTRSLLTAYGLRPRKSLSQNFLVDQAAADALVQAVAESAGADSLIIEIGAGLGALTVPLARLGRQLIAYETDFALTEPLQTLLAPLPDATVVHADITEQDFEAIAPDRRLAIVGNLPYHLSGLLLRGVMEVGHRCDVAVVTVQTEVGQRLTASPGDSQYGLLSVFAAYYLRSVETVRRLPPGVFLPPPQVSSLALALHPRSDPAHDAGGLSHDQQQLLFAIIRAAFAHRRKTLRNSLLTSQHLQVATGNLTKALARAEVDGTSRAEQLDLQDFVRLACTLHEMEPSEA